MGICLLWVSCVVRWSSTRRAHHSSRGVLPSVVCLSVIVKPRFRVGHNPNTGRNAVRKTKHNRPINERWEESFVVYTSKRVMRKYWNIRHRNDAWRRKEYSASVKLLWLLLVQVGPFDSFCCNWSPKESFKSGGCNIGSGSWVSYGVLRVLWLEHKALNLPYV
jgi:hypothetical protein